MEQFYFLNLLCNSFWFGFQNNKIDFQNFQKSIIKLIYRNSTENIVCRSLQYMLGYHLICGAYTHNS